MHRGTVEERRTGAIEDVAFGAADSLRRRRTGERVRVGDDVTERRDDAQADGIVRVAAQPVPFEQDLLRATAGHLCRRHGRCQQPRLLLQCPPLQAEESLLIRPEVENPGHGEEDEQQIERHHAEGDAGEEATNAGRGHGLVLAPALPGEC